MKYSKCACKVPDFDKWFILFQRELYTVVGCSECKAVWKTGASYVNELLANEAERKNKLSIKFVQQKNKGHGVNHNP